ncbi:DUF4194 domain-containing protein [Tepidibacter formicigenes]|uniref:DUF4194 domain-containing protein n=1 Tax=Tepidibacter formicigenes DSM 15518 TaxID=1123349 RepID=A0A1M6RFT5_9FIRM|nr:DUF4194 domain-containing protein [Tepidibacter formicigenes]SHK31256.1 protein of unknown function [Tepidibacter formicigenes DSM 15518]
MKEKYETLNTKEKENFSRICNKLLSLCFLTKKKEDNKKDYYFVQTHKEIFSQYLNIIGWELEIDETYGVIHLVNNYNYNRYNFKLYESIILLILRLLYHEKLKELSLADNVVIRIDDIHEKFNALKIKDKPIEKTTLQSALRLFKKYNIIEPIDRGYLDSGSRIIIYPSILLAIKVEDISKIYEKLDSYKKGGGTDEEAYEDEID